jgi:hypothetical protein
VVGHLVYIYINLFPMFHYIVLNIIYICVCAIFVDIIICVLFEGRGQSSNMHKTFVRWSFMIYYILFFVSDACIPTLCKYQSLEFLHLHLHQFISHVSLCCAKYYLYLFMCYFCWHYYMCIICRERTVHKLW